MAPPITTPCNRDPVDRHPVSERRPAIAPTSAHRCLPRQRAFPIGLRLLPAASTLGGFPTRAAVVPSQTLSQRPASENLHLTGRWLVQVL